MTSQDEQRLKRQLEKLEAQSDRQKTVQSNPSPSQPVEFPYLQFLFWYKGLPQVGQVVVIACGALIGLSLASTVVKLISLAISLTVLGVIAYLAYKFFKAPQSSKNNDL